MHSVFIPLSHNRLLFVVIVVVVVFVDVPILHVIPLPFPAQWHTKYDTLVNLHWPSMRNINRILRHFVYNYLQTHTEPLNLRI